MLKKINLEGLWNFQLDEEKQGLKQPFDDTITLPGTTSFAKKGKINQEIEIGCLTDEYKFEGHAWFSKEVDIPTELTDKNMFLFLERTRVTTVWVDHVEIGTQNSLNKPHVYDVTNHLTPGKHVITILVDNTNYPTRGGHMTSPDTQTNWNGITGRIELQVFNKAYLTNIKTFPNVTNRSVTIKAKAVGITNGIIEVSAESFNSEKSHKQGTKTYNFDSETIEIIYSLGEDALLWSEFEPNLYNVQLSLSTEEELLDTAEVIFGLREFKAEGDKFTINGTRTYLRGKHDGLIFPLTGFAPTTVEEWFEVLQISKSYGINHYRFHTCCPPEAAFTAADMLGIYMQPELPFWGTITDETYDNHNQLEQDYLINEGYAILEAFGNHPSFVMMSLGNELWGSKTRINEILGLYKHYDNRPLYTQGSNNFQWVPCILENDDFFSGVRFAIDRQFRGSYAMCDVPLGHVQTAEPSTMKDYDEAIVPSQLTTDAGSSEKQTIEIQYGTGVKKVEATKEDDVLIPDMPVVSHEIGQYQTYPDFNEIEKYTGSIKAKNFEVFKQRLEEKGLADLAPQYFQASGKLAMDCYKEELEAAFRSRKMAGFQILDLQDFSGQGTALVGVLDAFMESKGLISPEEWRSFCSDAVLLARFGTFNYDSGEEFQAHIELSYFRNHALNEELNWKLKSETGVVANGKANVTINVNENYKDICDIQVTLPTVEKTTKLTFSLTIENTDIEKTYELWVYPTHETVDHSNVHVVHEILEAKALLEKGENVVLFPNLDQLSNSLEGFYCTDFWCYPMFRSISESMNKEIPVGTMGLLIDNNHPVLKDFPSEMHSTYQWWNIVENSRAIILDSTDSEFRPVVQTIDNFERNHKLGMLFEANVLNGKLLVCAVDIEKISDKPEGKQFLTSLYNYVRSGDFQPKACFTIDELKGLLK